MIDRKSVRIPLSSLISAGPSTNQRKKASRKARKEEQRRKDQDDHRAMDEAIAEEAGVVADVSAKLMDSKGIREDAVDHRDECHATRDDDRMGVSGKDGLNREDWCEPGYAPIGELDAKSLRTGGACEPRTEDPARSKAALAGHPKHNCPEETYDQGGISESRCVAYPVLTSATFDPAQLNAPGVKVEDVEWPSIQELSEMAK